MNAAMLDFHDVEQNTDEWQALRLGKAGDVSGPIRTAFGVHVIRLTGKHSWIEADRNRVKRIILEERRQDLVSHYLNDLRQKAKVSVNDKAVKE